MSPHRIVSGAVALYLAIVGVQFYMYVSWALERSSIYVEKPAAVEAFLPISALLAAKRFLLTGAWDPVHPAGLVIFFFALASAFLLRKSFCGYFCPVGALSDFLFHIGRRFGLVHQVPGWLGLLLSLPKYVLLCFFLSLPLLAMSLSDIEAFLFSRYNLVCDTKLLFFFLEPGQILGFALLLLLAGSLFIPSFWCRSFCPYGALQGLFAFFSPTAVVRKEEDCSLCGRCDRSCPMGIVISRKRRVVSCECTGCMECVRACPKCLALQVGGKKHIRLSPRAFALLVLAFFVLCYLLARLSGHWRSEVPLEMVRMLHGHIHEIGHF